MRDEDIEFMLARDENLVPSSSFTASVMEAVTREATAPPPIPFPWKRALPGLGWCLAVIIAFIITGPGLGNKPPSAAAADLSPILSGAAWITGALLMSLLAVGLSVRIARRV